MKKQNFGLACAAILTMLFIAGCSSSGGYNLDNIFGLLKPQENKQFNGVELKKGQDVTLKGYVAKDGDNYYIYEKPNKQGNKLLLDSNAITIEDVLKAHNINKPPTPEELKKWNETGKAQYISMSKGMFTMTKPDKRGIVEGRVIDTNSIFPIKGQFDSSKDL